MRNKFFLTRKAKNHIIDWLTGSSAVGSALGSGPRGREFKSPLSDQIKGVSPHGGTPFYCYPRRLETNSKGTTHCGAALAATVRWTVALVRRKSPLSDQIKGVSPHGGTPFYCYPRRLETKLKKGKRRNQTIPAFCCYLRFPLSFSPSAQR